MGLCLECFNKYVQAKNNQVLMRYVFGNSRFIENKELKIVNDRSTASLIQKGIPADQFLEGEREYSVPGCSCKPVFLNNVLVGRCFEDEHAKYCFLGNIYPEDKHLSPSKQTNQTLENIKLALKTIGMDFRDVARTWFYLDKLYDWYSEFNNIRTSIFIKNGIFDSVIPASTGIGTANTHGTYLVSNVLAVKPKNPNVQIVAVPSPLQCEATNYQSSFSRAIEISLPTHRQLYISGTASIDNNGSSLHHENVYKQIDLTI
jgi:enamine deaminase RidA (YjgF/YER057c/UK114 family)